MYENVREKLEEIKKVITDLPNIFQTVFWTDETFPKENFQYGSDEEIKNLQDEYMELLAVEISKYLRKKRGSSYGAFYDNEKIYIYDENQNWEEGDN